MSQWRKDPDGRVLSIIIQFNSFAINLVCIHAPATCLTDRKVFFETIHEYCFPSDAIIFAGDFNCYEYKLDKLRGNFAPAKYVCLISENLEILLTPGVSYTLALVNTLGLTRSLHLRLV